MLRARKTIHAAVLPNDAGNFRDRREYLRAVANYIENVPELHPDLKAGEEGGIARRVDSGKCQGGFGGKNLRPYCYYGRRYRLKRRGWFSGPTVLESNAAIGENSVVTESVLWGGANIDPDCRIERSIIDHDSVVRSGQCHPGKGRSPLISGEGFPRAL